MGTDRASAASFAVAAKGFAFTPAELTVHVGDKVTWTNGDAESHAVQGGSLSSPEIVPGASYTATFTAPEDISYTCRFHSYMTGTIHVLPPGAGAAAPPTTKAPPKTTATTAPAAPATGGAPTTTTSTTAAPKVNHGTHGSAFQAVPDDPSARTPPGGDGRSSGAAVPPASSPTATAGGGTTPAPNPPTRGSGFQDIPDDPSATNGPGETQVHAAAASEEVVMGEDDDPAPPAGDTDLGDGTQLASYTEHGGVKEFHLTMDETEIEVSPGVKKPAYAFNGIVPGPVLRVNEGDRVRIVVDNQLPFPTSTHWHGMILPNDQDGVGGITQAQIEPGATYTYEWTAVATGTHWYHAHSSGRHIGKGLYGVLEVVPKKGDIEADHDYRLMLGDTDLGFTMNGRSFPSTPILTTKVGETVRLRVVNTGDQVHAFHLHGVPFQVMAQDGIRKPEPESMDTLTIAPGQTFDLLFSEQYPGDWVVHCHMFVHSHMNMDTHPPGESGMNGMTAIVRVTGKPQPKPPAATESIRASSAGGGGHGANGLVSILAVSVIVVAFALLYRRTRQLTLSNP
jgi:plastocyanin